jgi:hypothetical protein
VAKEDECERKPKKKTKPVVIKAFEVFEPFRGTLWPTLWPVYGPPFGSHFR